MPEELRSLALELLEDTSLQDATLAQLQRHGSPGSCSSAQNGALPSLDDVESYLWDFLETSQVAIASDDGLWSPLIAPDRL